MDDTQKKNVMEHLQSGRTITPLEALSMYGSLRLGAIIHVLRKELELEGRGRQIVTHNAEKLDEKTGRTKRFARYELVYQAATAGQKELF